MHESVTSCLAVRVGKKRRKKEMKKKQRSVAPPPLTHIPTLDFSARTKEVEWPLALGSVPCGAVGW